MTVSFIYPDWTQTDIPAHRTWLLMISGDQVDRLFFSN